MQVYQETKGCKSGALKKGGKFMSVAVVFKSPYVKGGKAAGKAGYIARRIGVDKSINNKVVINANYIATRPKVEKFGTHGLFSNKTDLNLNEVLEELRELKCNVWLPMLSLTREDATRFGYDNARAWQTLIQSKQADIAKIYKIPLDDLRWYAAFHNKDHHPHIHMLVYSASGGGFLTTHGIEQMKSCMVREICRDELYHLYDEKTQMREKLVEKSKERIRELKKDFSVKTNTEINSLFNQLADEMRTYKGKKVYSYLSKEQKEIVNSIYKKLSEDKNVAAFYKEWCNIQGRIMGYYQEDEIDFPKLYDNREFNKIRNQIISAASEKSVESNNIDNVIGDLVFSICKIFEGRCQEENRQESRRRPYSMDKKEYVKLAQKKQALGIKMGGM